jgi:hypothetical protein
LRTRSMTMHVGCTISSTPLPRFDPFARWRQGLNDATVRYDIAPALIDDRAEFAAHGIQVSNLSFNFGQVLARNRVNARAGSALLVRQAQKLAHLLNGKSQIARPPDEAQSSQMFIPVNAVVPACAPWSRQEVDTLIIADRFNFRAGRLGESADGDGRFRFWHPG